MEAHFARAGSYADKVFVYGNYYKRKFSDLASNERELCAKLWLNRKNVHVLGELRHFATFLQLIDFVPKFVTF